MRTTNTSVICAALALVFPCGIASAAIRDVPGTYVTITDAVNAATPGDTIRFSAPGTYPSIAGAITKNLTFSGPSNGHVSITPPLSGGRVFQIAAATTVSFDHLTTSGGALTLNTDRGAGFLNGGNLTLTNCTLTGNSAAASGGAIYNSGGATLSLTNCTLANNSVAGGGTLGGAAISNGGTVSLMLNCTVSNNSSSGVAGGLDNRNNNPFTIKNTLVAGNTGGVNPDGAGVFTSQDYNLFGDGTGVTFTGAFSHNQTGSNGSPINARLGPLQDNGGATYTVALLPNSPAIDAIPGSAPTDFPTTDQRDSARPVDGGDGDNIPEGDIGAYEAEAPTEFFVATSGSDGNSGVTANQPLRNVATAINRAGVSGIINIAPGTYTENLNLQKSLTLRGNYGAAANTVIQSVAGGSADCVMVVYPGTTLNVSDLTIAGGNSQYSGLGAGGGVFNEGTATLTRCVISGNQAAFSGGGIVNYTNSTLLLQDSAVTGNVADFAAGIENDGLMTMIGCTVSGNNTVSGAGGGIGNTGILLMTNCTVANNSALQGGGIYMHSGFVSIANVTITGNSAGDGGGIANISSYLAGVSGFTSRNSVVAANGATTGPDISGDFISIGGYNFIGNRKDATTTLTATDFSAVPPATLNANLGSLADNGGWTQTVSPNVGSPLIDAGPAAAANFPAADQRGVPRPIGAGSDIGAVEFQPRYVVTNTNDDTNAGSLRWAITQANATGNSIIAFAIAPTGAGGGAKTITLATPLPVITSKTFVDGWSQGGSTYSATPLIEIIGQNVPDSYGLNIQADNCSVRGLAINRFGNTTGNGFGIGIIGAHTGSWIYGCMLGTDPTGTIARGNGQGGISLSSGGTRLGSNLDGVNDAAEANVISANAFEGVLVTSSNNAITGNFIGTDITGAARLGNGSSQAHGGVRIESGAGNLMSQNSIAFNNGPGIDLGGDGITPNDLGDDDGGVNTLQNFPVITNISTVGGNTTISGQLNSSPVNGFTIEFFRSDSSDPSGNGEGQHYVSATNLTTDTNGNGSFSLVVPAIAGGQYLTATATNAGNNTSEFSAAIRVAYALADASSALKIAAGIITAGPADLRLNAEAGNAVIDIADAIRIARRVTGVDTNP